MIGIEGCVLDSEGNLCSSHALYVSDIDTAMLTKLEGRSFSAQMPTLQEQTLEIEMVYLARINVGGSDRCLCLLLEGSRSSGCTF